MSSNPTRLAPLLTTSARLPSGLIATATGNAGGGVATAAVGWVATDTVPTAFTFFPSIASTVTESSARLATSANDPGVVDRHARSLLAGLDRAEMRGRRCSQIDDVDLVFGYPLPAIAVLDPVERIGDQRQVPIGGDR